MPTIVDHDSIVGLLATTWAEIADLYAELDPSAYDLPTCLPGWSVKDQLSHLVATESGLAGQPMPTAEVSHFSYLRNEIATMNEVWIESMRNLPGVEVLERFRMITATRLDALRSMTQAQFDEPSWTPAGPDETYGRFMRIRHYDSFLHEHDAREAVGAPPRDEPGAISSCLDETSTAIGFIVGRRARIPAGHRVRIDLTGPSTRTYLLEVTDRARLVDRLEGDATIGIELSGPLFLRLSGGRAEAVTHLGSDIVLTGDVDLARQLATNLAFTI
jgi:uncharacterized protein (TIGR03083 family)